MKDELTETLRQQILELERALLRKEETELKLRRLATFPEQNPNLVIETDTDARITYLNPMAESLFPELWQQGTSHPFLVEIESCIERFQTGVSSVIAREVTIGASIYEQKICSDVENNLVRIFAHDITALKEGEQAILELADHQRRLSQRVVAAQEAERRRLARELHDEAGQALTALKMSLEVALADYQQQDKGTETALQDAIQLLESTRNELRAMAHGLRPPALDVMSLPQTLAHFCESFGARTRIEIKFQFSGQDARWSDVIEVTLYRFVQEALTNVAKYAGAKQVQVTLSEREQEITVSVKDNGRGFSVSTLGDSPARSDGMGLSAMRERIELLGGEFVILSEPGKGAELLARLPREASQ